MTCKDTAGRARTSCVRWEASQRRRCAEWRQEWTQRCDQWETRQEQRCTSWRQKTEQRCDRWEEEQTKRCSSWSKWFRWLCIGWTWVTTVVCRVWVVVTTTVCDVWTWVTTTVCRAWVWVATLVCTAWVWITTFICRLWVFVLDLWCLIWCTIRRLRAPNEVRSARAECLYAWMAAYRVEHNLENCVLTVTLRLRLVPQPDVSGDDIATVQDRWKPAIEEAWSRQFTLAMTAGSCVCAQYTVVVEVQWVSSGEHHAVKVHPGSGRADMTNWYVNSTGGTAAHEAGHMFGYPDEYPDDDCPNRVVTNDGSIMRNSQTGTVRPRHYQEWADWITNRTCCTYEVR